MTARRRFSIAKKISRRERRRVLAGKMIALSESCRWYENFGPQHFLRTAATEICYGAAEGPSRKRARVVNSYFAIPRAGSREPPNSTKGNGCPAQAGRYR